jgi:hypothetical protein
MISEMYLLPTPKRKWQLTERGKHLESAVEASIREQVKRFKMQIH